MQDIKKEYQIAGAAIELLYPKAAAIRKDYIDYAKDVVEDLTNKSFTLKGEQGRKAWQIIEQLREELFDRVLIVELNKRGVDIKPPTIEYPIEPFLYNFPNEWNVPTSGALVLAKAANQAFYMFLVYVIQDINSEIKLIQPNGGELLNLYLKKREAALLKWNNLSLPSEETWTQILEHELDFKDYQHNLNGKNFSALSLYLELIINENLREGYILGRGALAELVCQLSEFLFIKMKLVFFNDKISVLLDKKKGVVKSRGGKRVTKKKIKVSIENYFTEEGNLLLENLKREFSNVTPKSIYFLLLALSDLGLILDFRNIAFSPFHKALSESFGKIGTREALRNWIRGENMLTMEEQEASVSEIKKRIAGFNNAF